MSPPLAKFCQFFRWAMGDEKDAFRSAMREDLLCETMCDQCKLTSGSGFPPGGGFQSRGTEGGVELMMDSSRGDGGSWVCCLDAPPELDFLSLDKKP
jgi:hypothetical protein